MSAQFVVSVVTILVVVHLMLLSCAYLILLERKIAAWVQDRIGPNQTPFTFGQENWLRYIPVVNIVTRHRLWGLGQALADGVKLLVKEDYTPPGVEKALFLLAPAIVMVPAMLGWAVVPWGGYYEFPGLTVPASLPLVGGMFIAPAVVNVTALPINLGLIYVLAIGSMAVYGVVVGGYASNNKYSFLGGLRATAQMLSYEIPMGLCVLIVILMFGTARTDYLVNAQSNLDAAFFGLTVPGVWTILYQPLLAIIFFTCVLAECNRAPFDLAEAEQELVGGYHTEYSSMKWALFFLGEYMHMISGCAIFAVLFLGGWDIPFVEEPLVGGIGLVVLKFVVFAFKVFLLLSFMMLVRWTLPRFRFDQLMRLAWRSLIPICLVLLLVTGCVVFLGLPLWACTIANLVVFVAAAAIGPVLPQGPAVNRRVPLAGSRFSPLPAADAEG